jgi:hypothetical protein
MRVVFTMEVSVKLSEFMVGLSTLYLLITIPLSLLWVIANVQLASASLYAVAFISPALLASFFAFWFTKRTSNLKLIVPLAILNLMFGFCYTAVLLLCHSLFNF